MTGMEKKGRILVVDDEPLAREIIKGILESDFSVTTGSCGEDAVSIIPKFGPDIVILDAMMPGIDGWETCRQIRKQPQNWAVKIIMVSGKAIDAPQRRQGYAAGADDYLVNPFIHEDLQTKVQVWMRLKKAGDNLVQQIQELEQTQCKLKNANEQLEWKVIARTRELLKIEGELSSHPPTAPPRRLPNTRQFLRRLHSRFCSKKYSDIPNF